MSVEPTPGRPRGERIRAARSSRIAGRTSRAQPARRSSLRSRVSRSATFRRSCRSSRIASRSEVTAPAGPLAEDASLPRGGGRSRPSGVDEAGEHAKHASRSLVTDVPRPARQPTALSPYVTTHARVLALAALLGVVIAADAPAAAGQAPTWADRCVARLTRASTDLSRIAAWAGGGTPRIIPITSPYTGFLVVYDGSARHLFAMIEDYPGTTLEPWSDAGLGECPDESARPPDYHGVRNYAGRQAQIEIGRASARTRAAIVAVLQAALDECATY